MRSMLSYQDVGTYTDQIKIRNHPENTTELTVNIWYASSRLLCVFSTVTADLLVFWAILIEASYRVGAPGLSDPLICTRS